MYRLDAAQHRVVADAGTVADAHVRPHAARVDQEGAFPRESIAALSSHGLLGLTIPAAYGGLGHGLRTMAATLETVAQRCPSTAMVYLMHLCGVACYAAVPDRTEPLLRDAAAGRHLSTLAAGATKPLESTLYFLLRDDAGISVAGPWRGLGMRGNASAPIELEDVTLGTERALSDSGKGLDMMLGVVLPAFQVGTAAVAIGIAETAVQATIGHVTGSRLEHLNSSLADLPTLRAQIARMRIETDRARAHLGAVLDALETPGPATQLLVLEAKAAATEAAVTVTDLAMRTCGGAAFGGAHGLDRLFRDARAPIVMAPTSDQAYDFIGRALCGMEVF